ncbi:DNA-directed RNA polymerase subunit delta [Gorillibacterium timonense]|uniref:DNA-directed RNA polymerase subunit delta n=1 Tax=Gorillibacterium timonense TaxID=1689269 RepID=UPI00071E2155|nr:DNA-directed RNA polymerase subunit delta [Gorillibacterium timonense]
MVDLAFLILKTANTPFYYRDLMAEVAKYKGYSDDQVREVIAQLYTEINVDGRFACVGNNLWGLKRWYPVDNKAEDSIGGKRPRIINDDDDDLDEEDTFTEEEETYTADEDDFDSFNEDRDEVNEEEEEEFFPEAEEEEEAEELEGEEIEEEEDDFDDEAEEDEEEEDDDK